MVTKLPNFKLCDWDTEAPLASVAAEALVSTNTLTYCMYCMPMYAVNKNKCIENRRIVRRRETALVLIPQEQVMQLRKNCRVCKSSVLKQMKGQQHRHKRMWLCLQQIQPLSRLSLPNLKHKQSRENCWLPLPRLHSGWWRSSLWGAISLWCMSSTAMGSYRISKHAFKMAQDTLARTCDFKFQNQFLVTVIVRKVVYSRTTRKYLISALLSKSGVHAQPATMVRFLIKPSTTTRWQQLLWCPLNSGPCHKPCISYGLGLPKPEERKASAKGRAEWPFHKSQAWGENGRKKCAWEAASEWWCGWNVSMQMIKCKSMYRQLRETLCKVRQLCIPHPE